MTTYRVSEVYRTIQGEGARAGTPLVILRLQGCSVGCPWCDTKHSWPLLGGKALSVGELVEEVEKAAQTLTTVLVTGGEPAEQDLGPLVDALHPQFDLHLETSGTATGHMESRKLWDWVTVSPKANMPGGRPVVHDVLRAADELKFVIGKESHVEDAVQLVKEAFGDLPIGGPVISLQPLSASEKATKVCVDAALRLDWRLSLQQHKILGLP